MTRITGTLHEGPSTFMKTSRWILLRVRNVSDKICRENQNTRFMSNNFIFSKKLAVYEIMWKTTVQSDEPHDNIIPRLPFACWIVYKQTFIICNTYSFFTTTMATRKPLIVTWYVYCLPGLNGINLKLIRVPCSKAGHGIYSNNCTIIMYNSVQTCDSPPKCFGLFRPFS
jgi:hypothetical protein